MRQRLGFEVNCKSAPALDKRPHLDAFQDFNHVTFVGDAIFRIEIEFEGAGEDECVLWEANQSVTDGSARELVEVDAVDADGAGVLVDDSEEGCQEGAFPTKCFSNYLICMVRDFLPSCPAADAKFLPSFDPEGYVSKRNSTVTMKC
jgi:hypothetical protein